MNKDQYLNELKNFIKDNNLDGNIYNEYEEMINIGLEAGLSLEEVLAKMPDINKLISEDVKDKLYNYDISIDSAYLSLINIYYVDKIGIDYSIESIREDLPFEVKNDNYNFKLKDIKKISGKTDITLNLYIGTDVAINNFKINTICSDIIGDKINAKNIKLEVISSDIEIDSICCYNLYINSISGDIIAKEVEVFNNLHINTISGDVIIDLVKAESGKISTTSGDVCIKEYNENIQISTIVGSVLKSYKYLKNKIKDMFNKRSKDV